MITELHDRRQSPSTRVHLGNAPVCICGPVRLRLPGTAEIGGPHLQAATGDQLQQTLGGRQVGNHSVGTCRAQVLSGATACRDGDDPDTGGQTALYIGGGVPDQNGLLEHGG